MGDGSALLSVANGGWLDLRAELHVHTVLSPCAEVEMIPPLIVRRAQELGLGIIAITDHNAAANCAVMIQAAEGTGLQVLPGMETQTREEVHVVCLFDTVEQALTWQGTVFDHLPLQANNETSFGPQFVVDAAGVLVRVEHRLLLTATDLGLEDLIAQVRDLGGVAIPAHVDRPAFGLLANLGMVPAGLQAPALELSRRTSPDEARLTWPELARWPLYRSGDAHCLADMTAGVEVRVKAATVAELAMAFGQTAGRNYAAE